MKYAPYSASKIKLFEECPWKFNQWYVLKNRPPTEPKPFFEKGTFLHWILEHFPNKPKKPFEFKFASSKERKEWMDIARKILKNPRIRYLLNHKIMSEKKFALNSDMIPVHCDSKDILLMGYIDHLGENEHKGISIIDWKSGKSRVGTHDIQLKLYALWFLLIAPNIEEVLCEYAYVEQQEWDASLYVRDDIKMLREIFINKIDVIENSKIFEKNPSPQNCKYCDYFQICKPMKFKI